jgi:hypothetical protein
MTTSHPPWFRERDAGGAGAATRASMAKQAAKPDRPLRCHACGHVITTAAARRAVNGAHEYERTNPAGYRYRFGCFSQAPGCACMGLPSDEHSWFAGCSWRFAICAACGEHLGWGFSGADDFFGLILDRLSA